MVFFTSFMLCRAAASRGGREAERCQVSGATALHHPAHRGAPAQQRAGADWTTRGPQLSTPPAGEGPASRLRVIIRSSKRRRNAVAHIYPRPFRVQAREELGRKAERRTTWVLWGGMAYMATQFGILARLTWWEYSWDIMEPVTYFITYGTAMAMYAYFVLTRQVRRQNCIIICNFKTTRQ